MPQLAANSIADLVNGEYRGDATRQISRVMPVGSAVETDLAFVTEANVSSAAESNAGLLIVPESVEETDDRFIRVKNPIYAVSQVLREWFWTPPALEGIDETAKIDPAATIGEGVAIGPWVRIGRDAVVRDGAKILERCSVGSSSTIGVGTILYPNVVIYDDVEIGDRCTIHAGTVIGGDGFGFATHQGVHHKVPQIGGVVIGDDVEIGANSCIDRGTLGPTRVGRGTKIDDLVMIAHNVEIGEHCFFAAQSGIAGSARIGDYCAFGGQSGAFGHLEIGSEVQVAAQSVISKNVSGPVTISGTPGRPLKEQLRNQALVSRLPKLVERVAKLEKELRNDD